MVGLAALLVVGAALLVTLIARGWPVEVRVWNVAYVTYLLAARWPSSSDPRYLLLAVLVPCAGVVVGEVLTRPQVRTVFLSVALAVGWLAQWVWVSGVLTNIDGPSVYP